MDPLLRAILVCYTNTYTGVLFLDMRLQCTGRGRPVRARGISLARGIGGSNFGLFVIGRAVDEGYITMFVLIEVRVIIDARKNISVV